MRAVGILKDGDSVFLIRRIKGGKEYYVFPGGEVKKKETPKEAVKREIKEELGIAPKKCRLAFEYENKGNKEYYFLMSEYEGMPRLGGSERIRMNEKNQYYVEKFSKNALQYLDNLHPQEIIDKVIKVL